MSDMWQPSATISTLQVRANLFKQIRNFFENRGFLEVETPVLGRFGVTDVYLSNFKTAFRGQFYYLQTSPEYHMKRLLAAGSGAIYQLARVFRDDEVGRWHNPEFTLLEWYQLGISHHILMDEVDTLLQVILNCEPMCRKSYRQVFLESCGIDPISASLAELKVFVQQFSLGNILAEEESDRDQYLFLLMSFVVEPVLAKSLVPIAVYDFPESQASLARISPETGFAERFEIYFQGAELANGFHELTDPEVLYSRFQQDLESRKSKGVDLPAIDTYLLGALEHGLPACSGVALGVDRLLAIALKFDTIAKTMSFGFNTA